MTTEEETVYFEVHAGTLADPGIILTWGWGTHAEAHKVGCALLGRTADEAFDALGADGAKPVTIDVSVVGTPCVLFDGNDDDWIARFDVVKLAASTTSSDERELSRTTTVMREDRNGVRWAG